MTSTRPSDAELVALADVVLDLAHQLDVRNAGLREAVPLTGTEVAVIREIHRRPRSTPSEIAEATGLQRSNVSTAIRSLAAGGLVVREQVAGNARSVALVPTELAEQTVARIHTSWVELLRAVPPDQLAGGVAATSHLADIAAAVGRGE